MGKSKVSNRSFDSKEPSQKMDDTIKESPPSSSQTSRKLPRGSILYLIISFIVGTSAFCLLVILLNHQTPTQETKEIKEIKAKKEILVHPGEKESLKLNNDSNKVDWKGLDFKIDNEDIVGITIDGCVVGLDGLGDKDIDNTTIYISGNGVEPAKVTVTVKRQENSDNNHILEKEFDKSLR